MSDPSALDFIKILSSFIETLIQRTPREYKMLSVDPSAIKTDLLFRSNEWILIFLSRVS